MNYPRVKARQEPSAAVIRIGGIGPMTRAAPMAARLRIVADTGDRPSDSRYQMVSPPGRRQRDDSMSTFSPKWDERFMLLAHEIAGWSKEAGRHVGTVIVGPDKEIRATGFNGFPRGVNDEIESRHSRETGAKYLWSSHAERNAIYNAARVGVPLKGCTIYVPWFPCVECAKAIIQSGIEVLVAYQPDLSEQKWGLEFEIVLQMMSEAGVKVRYLDRLRDLQSGS
jgi:dCMP deaminase